MFNIAKKITLVNGGTRGSNLSLLQESDSIVRITYTSRNQLFKKQETS